jgi:hypothetical protein
MALLVALAAPAAARAAVATPDQLGVNTSTFNYPDFVSMTPFSTASANGVGQDRAFVDYGHFAPQQSYYDNLVMKLAIRHVRVYATMWLGSQESNNYVTDAQRMVTFASALKARYGPSGSLWAANPNVRAYPILDYEVGNEENSFGSSCMLCFPASQYGYIYHQVQAAVHPNCSDCVTVVGGLLDSGNLSAVTGYLPSIGGPVDAIGYHPYLYDETLIEGHLGSLVSWLNRYAVAVAAPIHMNEFDAYSGGQFTLDQWAQVATDVTRYAICNHYAAEVAPYWLGDVAFVNSSPWFAMYDAAGNPTHYAFPWYFGETHALTTGTGGTGGCV